MFAVSFIWASIWLGLWPAPGDPVVREIPSPAAGDSGQPNLATGPDGAVFLSWVERLREGRHVLRFSRLQGDQWSPPRTIREGDNWFVNWADFPSMTALRDGTLAAHWLAKSGSATFSYDVNITLSVDGGRSWSEPVVPHRDGTRTEHGFVSLFAAPGAGLGAVWLDGREMSTGSDGHSQGDMTLRFAALTRTGSISNEKLLDARTCECCQTSAVMTASGPVVVYRDRSEREIRDISLVRWHENRWLGPRPVHEDGWEIHGCPVNGPAAAADGERFVVAWFTGAHGRPALRLAFSGNSGETIGNPVAVDDGDPLGRVDVALLPDGSAVVLWMERAAGGAEIRFRRVKPDGALDPSVRVAPVSAARSSGFPHLVRSGRKLVFAWTSGGVKTAQATIP